MKGIFIISGLGILAMLSEIFKFKKLLFPIVLLGVLAAYVSNFFEWNTDFSAGGPFKIFDNMIRFDNVSLAFSGVILATLLLWFVLANDCFEKETTIADHFTLVLFSVVGALMMVSYTNMTTLFLGIETLSIPMYVLAASQKNRLASNEAGFKYLIMGSFASGFLLFGMALVYGATASFDIATIASYTMGNTAIPGFFYVGVMMMLVAMCFKVGAAPFHFWTPDVYQGSPTVITALMSTVVKTAAFAAFIRLFMFGFLSTSGTWSTTLSVIIALSLVISNITAATQTSVKRMLAYSSISHAAFMLMAILAGNNAAGGYNVSSMPAVLYYSLAYSIGSITAFTVLYNVAKKSGNESFDAFNGLAKRSPMLAACMTIAMLSLAGIPITGGFFAKYFIFSTLIGTSFKWLLILAVLTSAVGVYYYFRVIIAMYFKPANTEEKVELETSHVFLVVFTSLVTLAIGVVPDLIIKLI